MPTATSFAWSLPWEQIVGGFNNFITMLNTPLALAVSLLLVFGVAGYVVHLVRKAHQQETTDQLLASGEVADYYNDPRFEGPRWDDYEPDEQRELAEQYLHGFRFNDDDDEDDF
jgi:hypothetical protein